MNEEILDDKTYEANVDNIARVFASTLKEYERDWLDVPHPEIEGIAPISGIVLMGSYGDHTATADSDIDLQVFVDKNVLGGDPDDAAIEFGRAMGKKLKTLHIDPTVTGIDFRDKGNIAAMLEQAEGIRPVVIMYRDDSDVRTLVQPVTDGKKIPCRWISVAI